MKILVTGGAGFIGSNVVDGYIQIGHDVSIIDNLSTGNKKNINPKAKFYNIDIRDKKVEEIFKKEKFDFVNHHAAQIDVRKSVSQPDFDADVNIIGLINLLKNSAKYKVEKFINISSGGVIYGGDISIPTKEGDNKAPISPYGISKLAGEYYLEFFKNIYGLNYTALRYANVFGIRQDPLGEAGVVAIFCNLLKENKQPVIYGTGKQTRDYVYVKDIVAANVACLDKGNNEAFNIGTSIQTDVNKLFEILKKISGYKDDAKHVEKRPGEVENSALNVAKAKKILNWQPKYSLEQGLKETFEWVQSI